MAQLEQYTFFDALIGLIIEPSNTTASLYEEEKPPYVGVFVALFVIMALIPVLYHLGHYGSTDYAARVVFTITLIVVLSLGLFAWLEAVFLYLLGIEFRLYHIFSTVAYCLAPWILGLLLIYTANFLLDREFTLTSYLFLGYGEVNPRLLKVIPFVFIIAQLNTVIIFYNAVLNLGKTHWITSLIITFLSVFPLLASVFLSIHLGNLVVPETASTFFSIMRSIQNLLVLPF